MSDAEYPSLKDDIAALGPDAPGDRAALMLMADMALTDARTMRDAPEAREPQHVDAGWSLSIETRDGIVGLWSCWLKDQFYLGFPSSWADDMTPLIASAFEDTGVIRAPRWRSDYGRHVGDFTVRFADQTASLAVDQHASNCQHFHVLRGRALGKYGPPQVGYGWALEDGTDRANPCPTDFLSMDQGRRVASEPFWRPEGIEPGRWDSPNPAWTAALAEFYATMRRGFMRLACDLANAHGVGSVTAELGFVVVPEQLEAAGFDVTWLRGTPGERKGWQQDAVWAERQGEQVMLVSANSLVPWVCYRRLEVDNLTPGWLDSAALTF